MARKLPLRIILSSFFSDPILASVLPWLLFDSWQCVRGTKMAMQQGGKVQLCNVLKVVVVISVSYSPLCLSIIPLF